MSSILDMENFECLYVLFSKYTFNSILKVASEKIMPVSPF